MRVEKKLITPFGASEMLKNNNDNRRLKSPIILRYSAEMQKGLWKENTGEMIKISKSGRVLDGQHRLKAVILSGQSINFHIAYDLENEIFDVLDTGSSRNASDSFYISGVKSSNTVPAIITTYYLLQNGYKSTEYQKNTKLSNAELLIRYNDNKAFWDEITTMTIKWYQNFSKVLTPSIIGGFFALLIEKSDFETAKDFMTQLCEGVNIKNYSINASRNALIKDKISIKKMPMTMKWAIIIKTWNFYRMNKTVQFLKWDSQAEKFPTIL